MKINNRYYKIYNHFDSYPSNLGVIVIDFIKKLKENGYQFYDDYWGQSDQSSKRNHLMIDREIPKEFIKKIVTF